MVDFTVPWPLGSFPGIKPQEGAGRLINVHPDARGGNEGVVWRRAPGAKVFARAPSVGAAAGSATALGVSSVKDMEGLAQGDSTASAVGEAA